MGWSSFCVCLARVPSLKLVHGPADTNSGRSGHGHFLSAASNLPWLRTRAPPAESHRKLPSGTVAPGTRGRVSLEKGSRRLLPSARATHLHAWRTPDEVAALGRVCASPPPSCAGCIFVHFGVNCSLPRESRIKFMSVIFALDDNCLLNQRFFFHEGVFWTVRELTGP